MRVLVDGRKYGHGGIGVYLDNLVRGLLELNKCTVRILANPDTPIPNDVRSSVEIINHRARPYSLSGLFKLGRDLPRDIDLYHTPHFPLPFGIRVPTVLTVHDLIHIEFPEHAYYPLIARPLVRSSVRRASRTLTVSEASKLSLQSLVGQNTEFTVLPNALNAQIATTRVSPEARISVHKLTEGRPFLLCVVSLNKRHKAPRDAIEAFYLTLPCIRTGAFPEMDLVFVGQGTDELKSLANKRVKVLGSVPSDVLHALYSSALALIIPSRSEGFCLPMLEAHACGTPVVSYPVPAILEQAAPEDCFAENFSYRSLGDAMARMLESEYFRIDRLLGDKPPLIDLQKYSRSTLASKLLAIYQEVLNKSTAEPVTPLKESLDLPSRKEAA